MEFYVGLFLGGTFVATVLLLIYVLLQNKRKMDRIKRWNEKLKYDKLFKVDIEKRFFDIENLERGKQNDRPKN